MFILSISISPNRNTVTEESLGEYVKVLNMYLDVNSSRYVYSLEKGTRDFHNHIQCVCETTFKPDIVRQYLNRNMSKLLGYNKGRRGKNDGSTICVVNRTKNGTAMFGYPLKENPTIYHQKGMSSIELEQFRRDFANLPDFKMSKRRNSTRADGVEKLINLLWEKLIYYDTIKTYKINTNDQRIKKFIDSYASYTTAAPSEDVGA